MFSNEYPLFSLFAVALQKKKDFNDMFKDKSKYTIYNGAMEKLHLLGMCLAVIYYVILRSPYEYCQKSVGI